MLQPAKKKCDNLPHPRVASVEFLVNSVDKIKIWLKSDKNNGRVTRKVATYVYVDVSPFTRHVKDKDRAVGAEEAVDVIQGIHKRMVRLQ